MAQQVESKAAGAMISYPFETPPAAGEMLSVAENVFWIRLPLPMALDHVNVYALDDGDGWTILDTGFATKKGRAIWQALLDGPLAGKPVNRIVVTHHHPDHVGLAGWFVAQGASLHIARVPWLMARMLVLDEQDRPTAETLAFYKKSGMDQAEFEKRQSERPFNFADCVAPLPLGYSRLQEGGTIVMGGRVWDIRVGHGHAPEHLTFWSRADNLVIGGDQLLPSISPNLGVYPTEPEADPVAEWLTACAAFQPFATPDQLVLGGHKLPFTGLPTRLEQLIENHHGALARLRDFLATPRTASACFPALFKRKIGGAEYGLALVEAVAHVNHLYLSGEATRRLNDQGAWEYQVN